MTRTSVSEMPDAVEGNLGTMPVVSIIIPLRRRARHLEQCLESIRDQTYPHDLIEIVILEDRADEASRKIVREFHKRHPSLRLIRQSSRSSHSSSRHSSSTNEEDIIVAIDPDATLANDFLETVVSSMVERQSDCVGGRVTYVSHGYFRKAAVAVLGSKWVFPMATQDDFDEGDRPAGLVHAAYRRKVVQQAGVLEHEMLGNESEIATRLSQQGHRIHFNPAIASYLSIQPDLFYLLGWAATNGLAWANRLKKQPGSFRWRFAMPAVVMILGAALMLGGQVWPWLFAALPWLFGIYLGANVLVAVLIARRQGWQYLLPLPLILAVLHLGFGTGTIAGLVTGKRRGSALPKWVEKSALIISDYIAIIAAFFVWSYLRSELGLFSLTDFAPIFFIANFVFIFWFLFLLLFGLYRTWNAASRVDEAVAVFKTVGLGVLAIFLITFDLQRDFADPIPTSRMLLASYWLLVAGAITTGRMILRTIQRRLLENGIGLHRTVIVGWNQKARELCREVLKYPALGYQVIGFVDHAGSSGLHQYQGIPVLGALDQLAAIIMRHQVEEVLIALKKADQKALMQVIAQTDGLPVSLKIVPDLYSIITGQARTNQIYGFPLVEILPQYMPTWERVTKRMVDLTVSLSILLLGLPIWIIVALAIKLNSPGPVFYRQERVGKNGAHFTIFKFRSMVANAEQMTGPKWADKEDPRITSVGRFLRKWRIDEIPQFINVLRGEMSIVGPRPERPYFVELLRQEIPLYTRRLRVQPGITGWAQIKGAYDASIDDVKQKLKYDLFYLENMSIKMDLKILLHTIYVMLAGRGQ